MILTKTNFIQFLNCPKSLWLLKNKPEEYPDGEFSLFLEKLIKDGYEVEDYAMKLFSDGIDLGERSTVEETKKALEGEGSVFFQPSFETKDGVFARVDILEKNEDGSLSIYEVKSSTSVKKDPKHNHVKDACFQKYVVEKSGYKVSGIYIIHLNKNYILDGEVNPHSLLVKADIKDDVDDIYKEVVGNIEAAVELLQNDSITEDSCSCKQKTKSNHCDSFQYFNKDMPDHSIYHINNISKKKIWKLLDEGLLDLVDVHSDCGLNEKQMLHVQSVKSKEPSIDYEKIKEKLDALKFPLHFIDYETFPSAVPKVNGTKPHQQVPFQVSIHTMYEDGNVEHFEYLSDKLELPEKMVNKMKDFTDLNGTFISWHASFEQSRNKEMMEMFPEYTDYLVYMNNHMFDLKTIFSEGHYVDYRFNGSNSIKDVQPVLVPDLSYKSLEVQNGTMALDLWGRMVMDQDFEEDKDEVRKSLFKYCGLDTEAMVEIYLFLKKILTS
jgi:hypothetical protein